MADENAGLSAEALAPVLEASPNGPLGAKHLRWTIVRDAV
jgi:hypothetical protein